MNDALLARFAELHEIARSLSAKRDTAELLSLLLGGARKLTHADGGTIYLLDKSGQLHFSIMQSQTLSITDPDEALARAPLRPIPLVDENGAENRNNVAALTALEGVTINIPDVYADDQFHFEGVKRFDEQMGYRTKSLLTVPIHNERWGVVGILQLVNCSDPHYNEIRPFSAADALLAEALSLQAGTHIAYARMQGESEQLLRRVTELNRIGISLSSQRSTEALLEEILTSAKALTHADAGTLYLYRDRQLHFEVVQTDSLGIRVSSAEQNLAGIEPIDLYDADGNPNTDLVAACVALSGETINIPDAYEAKEYNFSGTKRFDEKNGYRSKSFLTVPMKNQKNELIGVLQLINAKDPAGDGPVPFSSQDRELAESLASLAAVALTNKRLNEELQLLLDSFIEVISDSIDEMSPYTGGHCRRVPELAMMLAKAAVDESAGPLAAFTLSDEQMHELKIAAMLHDCGKITTPVHVVDKSTKLETIHDRIDLLDLRHEIVRRDMLIERLWQRLGDEAGQALEEARLAWTQLAEEVEFLRQCNIGGEFMDPEKKARVQAIAEAHPWRDAAGREQPFVSGNEMENLNIEKGTLTAAERDIINHHAVSTRRMLDSLPFPKNLQRVPEIAGSHHERMDGKGYPNGLKRDQMSVQARILGIADIFEALTAADRPYKRCMPLSKALAILKSMSQEGHIDPDLFEVFVAKKLYLDYGRRFLKPEQLDI